MELDLTWIIAYDSRGIGWQPDAWKSMRSKHLDLYYQQVDRLAWVTVRWTTSPS